MNNRYADGKLLARREGPVAIVTLNQPDKRNALAKSMWRALPELANDLEAEPGIRVVRICGAGDDAFSAGADISEFERVYADTASTDAYNRVVREGQAAIRYLNLPTIAEISGVCVGGGMGLALACDVRFATDTSRFAITPAKLGLAYSFEDTQQLVEKVGPARAKDILFTGRQLMADEALSIGLIDRAVPASELATCMDDYCALLCNASNASIAVLKQTINSIADGDTQAPRDLVAEFEALFDGPHFKEGYRAFLAKRRPEFQ
ncbi:MAG: enoyl-CoA hydratase-related protein [Pseudomonadota bacterium]